MAGSGVQTYNPSEIIFMEGDPGDCMYVLVKGKVKIQKRAGAQMQTLAELGPGAILGEMSLLDKQPRSATAKTVEHTQLAVITQDVLQATYSSLPAWFSAVFRVLTGRLRDTQTRKYATSLATAYAPFIHAVYLYCLRHKTDTVPLPYLRNIVVTMCNLRSEDAFKLAQGIQKLDMGMIGKDKAGNRNITIINPAWLKIHYDFLLSKHYNKKSDAASLGNDAGMLLQLIYNLAMENGDKKARQTMISVEYVQEYVQAHKEYEPFFCEHAFKELASNDLLKQVTGAEQKQYYSIFPQNCAPVIAFHEISSKITNLDLPGLFA
jgi:CRP-like cAMP-binding protein